MPKIGYKQTPETIAKRTLKLLGNKSRTGQVQSQEERHKKSLALKGREKPFGHGQKVSDAQRGIERPNMQFDNHPNWKGGISVRNQKLSFKERLAGRIKPDQCEVCGSGERICFDHDHKTGKFRGWICNGCNAALGHARDNTEVLQKLIEYLIKSREVKLISLSNVPLNQ